MDVVITLAVGLAVMGLLIVAAAALGSAAGGRDAARMQPTNRVVGGFRSTSQPVEGGGDATPKEES